MSRFMAIGIGGTGARCVEALLHVCAAGLGPDELSIGLIDQDANNGNLKRTQTLATTIARLKTGLRQEGVHKLSPRSRLLRTTIKLINGDGTWHPLTGASKNVTDAFVLPDMPAVRPLFEALYTKNEREMTLDKGYRAVPSLGAAIMGAKALSSDPFWKAVSDELRQAAGGGGGARLFIFGSLFGGTGAAGFPTLSRVLREHPSMQGVTGYLLGGALMLPYFQFGERKVEDNELRGHASKFAERAEDALRYYNQLFENQKVFDDVYVIGWNPSIRLPYMDDGGLKQTNPAMIPELYAALAANRFFLEDRETNTASRFFKIGAKQAGKIDWTDMPPASQGVVENVGVARERARAALAQLLRFSFAFRRVFRPALSEENWKRYRREEWLNRLVGQAEVSLDDPVVQGILKDLDAFSESHLKWTSELAAAGVGGDDNAADTPLYSYRYYGKKVDQDPEGWKIVLHDEFDGNLAPIAEGRRLALLEEGHRAGFRDLLAGEARAGLALSELMERLTYDRIDLGHEKLGRMIGELHSACMSTQVSSADEQ